MKEYKSGKLPIAQSILAYTIMGLFSLITVLPLLWLLLSSFKPHRDIINHILSLPTSLYLTNFVKAWELGNLGLYFLNSIYYVGIATTITVILAMATGYGFAKFNYKINTFLFGFFMIGLLITVQSAIVPLFIIERALGLYNTRLGVLFPYVAFGLPFAIFLATTYIKGIPDALEQAAIIDGATYLQIFWKIILPISKPVVTTILIFTFLGNWNEFVFVLLLTSKASLRSLQVGIQAFSGGMSPDVGIQTASLVIGTAPMVIFYLLFRKQLSVGFAGGAVKG